jgi:hypothetical protein
LPDAEIHGFRIRRGVMYKQLSTYHVKSDDCRNIVSEHLLNSVYEQIREEGAA